MTRKHRPTRNPFQTERARLRSRRQFLIGMAGGSLALLFPLSGRSDTGTTGTDTYAVLDAVVNHLLPSEVDSPGAKDIHALDYFRFVIDDSTQDAEERDFLRQGTVWLDALSQEREQRGFTALDADARERILRQVEQSQAGENWLSTVLLTLMEAVLTDPVYGGNFEQRGWKWLQHTPGYPRPPKDKTYPELLKS